VKTFKSISDVKQVLGTPVHDTVRELVVPVIESFSESAPYRPEDDGYLVLIERDDVDRVLNDLDIPAWSNNSCGLLIVGFDQSAKAFPASNGRVTRILLRLLSNSSVPRQHTRCEAPWRCCPQITVSVTE
jgi:hypothetical protein